MLAGFVQPFPNAAARRVAHGAGRESAWPEGWTGGGSWDGSESGGARLGAGRVRKRGLVMLIDGHKVRTVAREGVDRRPITTRRAAW